ncbi:MAG TPA: hypothetical protein VFA63_03745 [Pseudonocardiaceae bacterium]|nr:hypothetical protein [Pseudonocardiaceae bacterium]
MSYVVGMTLLGHPTTVFTAGAYEWVSRHGDGPNDDRERRRWRRGLSTAPLSPLNFRRN